MNQRRKFSLISAAFLFALFVCVGPIGSGVAHASTTITTCTQLQNIGSTTGPLSGSYVLGGNIDCSATAIWNPISGGGFFGFFPLGNFTGTFNGGGYSINNLYIHTATSSLQGLFSQASATSTIQNLTLSGGSVSGTTNVGAIVGQLHNTATIQNVTSSMSVNGSTDIGGLVGQADASTTIASSSVNAIITITNGSNTVGGIAGSDNGLIQNASSTGSIIVVGNDTGIGGIAGTNGITGQITNTQSSMSIQSSGSIGGAGGLVGYNDNLLQNSYFTGSINASTTSNTSSGIGGIVGQDYSTFGITNTYYNVNAVSIMGGSHETPFGIYNTQYSAWVAGSYAPLSFSTYFPSTDSNGYYDITSLSDLENFLAFDETNLSADKFKITSAITLPAELYIPMLDTLEFNGGNNAITGLSLSRGGWDYDTAFIGQTTASSSVTNINLVNVSVAGETAGGIVGVLRGTLTNSSVTGSVSGNGYTGGAIGRSLYSYSTTSGVQANVTVTGTSYGSDGNAIMIGGFTGNNAGAISNSSEAGSVTDATNGAEYIGGFSGFANAAITNSYATDNVIASGTSDESIGGFIGYSDGDVSNVYATGNVTANGSGSEEIGGLMGTNYSSNVASSSASGTVSASGYHSEYIGGLLGDSYGAITTSYSTGNVIATSSSYFVGGFDGEMDGGVITESYETGNVTGGSYETGGFAGGNYGPINVSFETGNVYVYGNPSFYDYYTGGFVGYTDSSITDDYATGNIVIDSSVVPADIEYTGGFDGDTDAPITDSYASGSIIGSGPYADTGGFIGYDNAQVLNSFSTVGGTGLSLSTTTNSAGYFAGTVAITRAPVNVAELTQGTPAIGQDNNYSGSSDASLVIHGYGTDESTLSNFYSLTEPVYAQATTTAWDFTSIWETHPNALPTFQWYSGVTPTYTISASAGTGGVINNAGNLSVLGGSSQSYNIIVNSGYTIANVLVDGVSIGAVSTYTFSNVSANHTISVTFTAPASGGGGGGSYGGGTVQNRVTNLVTNGNISAATALIQQYPTLFPNGVAGLSIATSSVAASSTSSGASITSVTFNRSLTLGSIGTDVKALQEYLNANGFNVAKTGAGSAGNETTYFGKATRAALAKFQKASGISPAVGYFGSITRAYITTQK